MRTVTVVGLLIAVALTVPLLASDFSLAAFALRSPQNWWAGGVRDYIVRKPTLQAAASCGSPIACSLITANTSSRCESVSGTTLFAAYPTLRLYGALYYQPGRLKQAKKPLDPTVVDGSSAVAHEYEWHIIPAASGVIALLEELQSVRFASRSACQRAAEETSAAVVARFAEVIAETQREEVATGRRPTNILATGGRQATRVLASAPAPRLQADGRSRRP